MNREQLIAPEQYNLVSEFERYATGTGKKALIYVDVEGNKKELTYDELIASANKAANVFKSNGLEKGDAVLVMVPRLIEAYVTYIGALKAGLVVIPSSEMLRSSDIEYRLAHSDAKAIVAFDAFTDQFSEVKNMEDVKLFVVGEAKKGQLSLTGLMELHQRSSQHHKQKVRTWHFYPTHRVRQGNQKGSFIRTLGDMRICGQQE